MRNVNNAIEKVQQHKGRLSKSIVCYTAKQTLNQLGQGRIKPTGYHAKEVEAKGIREMLEHPLRGRRLDADLTSEGLAWMQRFFFKANGKPRKTQALRYVPAEVFEIIKHFSHFTFEGFGDDGYGNLTPAWTVHSKRGARFTYSYNGGRFNPSGGLEVWGL